eukprot:8756481-Pyramimonas_sp.AAC.1
MIRRLPPGPIQQPLGPPFNSLSALFIRHAGAWISMVDLGPAGAAWLDSNSSTSALLSFIAVKGIHGATTR